MRGFEQLIGMLLTAVALLSRFNASRVSADGGPYEITNDYQECGTSFFMKNIEDWSDDSELDTCYYLDYSSSITLTVDGSKYKNPIFFCPNGASEIKFQPDDGIYCTEFSLYYIANSDPNCEVYNSIYITTESSSIKTPVSTSECELGYFDLILAPVPSGTIAHSGTVGDDGSYYVTNILTLYDSSEETSTVTVTKSSSTSYTIKNSINQRYSISIPSTGPYVFNGKSGLSIGAIVGIAVVAVVVVGAAVGVSLYFILKNRNKGKDGKRSESSS